MLASLRLFFDVFVQKARLMRLPPNFNRRLVQPSLWSFGPSAVNPKLDLMRLAKILTAGPVLVAIAQVRAPFVNGTLDLMKERFPSGLGGHCRWSVGRGLVYDVGWRLVLDHLLAMLVVQDVVLHQLHEPVAALDLKTATVLNLAVLGPRQCTGLLLYFSCDLQKYV